MAMGVNERVMREEIRKTLTCVENQIVEVKKVAFAMRIEASELRTTDGSWALMPLLCAKIQALHALAMYDTRAR